MKITLADIRRKKERGEKITMLTAYDHPLAALIDRAGIDMILVGDSLANVVLGLESTTQVGMTEMLHHAKAARRGVREAFFFVDMPYEAYQPSPRDSLANARRFVEEAGAEAVKIEWFDQCLAVTEMLVGGGIAVMGHIGLTPQTADKLGGFKVQGKTAEVACELIRQAEQLEKSGCFSLLLECIPAPIAKIITSRVRIPTIGIGSGPFCDGQVLVTHDLLGLYGRTSPKFVKKYVDLSEIILKAVSEYKREVSGALFPDQEHSFSIKKEELEKLGDIDG